MAGGIARIVTRPSNDAGTECDLLIGTMYASCAGKLKPNTVYEVQDFLDTLTLVEVGKSVISPVKSSDSPIGVTWFSSFEDVVMRAGKYLLISEKEFAMIEQHRKGSQDD